ncbi:hypothetical protein VPNG_04598 [Cytospora leucostoma]|uniref:Uncharacterized protein n=1 Tax=Cytospora leucostoma TaxID=1230097 RepID=A0A423XCG6_9PEZI|nr:hypothetical protein VPNG_04598 [Cytospora leucostoma]
MAEPTTLNLNAVQAVVTWAGTEGQTYYLYRHDNDRTLQVTLDMKYDGVQGQSGCTGFFRLCVPVDLKALPREKTPLLLYIRPEHVASLLCQQRNESELSDAQVDDVDTLVREKLGSRIVCLKFVLNNPADMVVPSGVALVPTKQRPHGEQIDLLMHLAQSTSFSIFFQAQDVSLPLLLRDFADAIVDPARSVRSHAEADDIALLYSGQGGRVFDITKGSAPPLPPSYENVGVPPPMAPLDLEEGKRTGFIACDTFLCPTTFQQLFSVDDVPPVPGPSTSSKSRKRRRDSDMDEASNGQGIEAACKNMVENILRQARQEDRAFMTKFIGTEIQTLKSEIMAEIQKNKMEMMQYIDGCTDELEYRVNDVEKGLEESEHRVDVQVDDAIISYKIEVEEEKETFKTEMREFVTERLDELQESAVEDVEERVMNRLNGARVLVEQARLSLE